MRSVNKIVHDTDTYIESVGKKDQLTLAAALADSGEDTVLRMCLGATTDVMPLRVLGYAASAMVVHTKYFPKAQLQFVHPLHAAQTANGLKLDQTLRQAQLFDFDRLKIGGKSGESIGLVDILEPDDRLIDDVKNVLAEHSSIAQPLYKAASVHNGDPAQYLASHLEMHDSNAQLVPINEGYPERRISQRIISIGAQSERMFYLARMACRLEGVLPTDSVEETGQLFTKHVLPPYLHCREGELSLHDYYSRTRPIYGFETDHAIGSVTRDLQFLSKFLYDQFAEAELAKQGIAADFYTVMSAEATIS